MSRALRIAICSLRIGEVYQGYTKYAPINKKEYCAKHGYTYIEDNDITYDTSLYPAWSKIHLILKCLATKNENGEPMWDFVVWMDADLYIMNQEWKLEHFIYYLSQGRDITVGSDWVDALSCTAINTGVMFCCNTPWTSDLLKAVLTNKDYPVFGNFEQDSFQDLVKRDVMNAADRVSVIWRSREVNSYWYNYYKGDFILHMAGNRGKTLLHMMNKWCPVRMDEDTDESYATRMLWLESAYRTEADDYLISTGQKPEGY